MIRRDFLGLVGATLVGSLAQADELKHPDIWLKDDQKAVFESVIKKLDMVERTVGSVSYTHLTLPTKRIV